MKERFMKRRLTGTINIACKYDDGSVRWWSADKAEIVQHIVDIVEQYMEMGYTLSLRQLHYRLVAKNWIINHQTAYKKLGNILDDCRYAGIVDWDAIADRGRVPFLPYSVDSIAEALEDTHNQYRRDRQANQEAAIELWTEKDALSDILRRSTVKYHVRLCVNKGYTSSSAIYEAYNRIIDNIRAQRFTHILYFGDHDPSGLDMVRDIRERLSYMIENGRFQKAGLTASDCFEVRHIGLTKRQVDQYKLPPNPAKMTDTRADKYIAQFGKICWEVDALEPPVLTQIIETNITSIIEVSKFEQMLVTEKAERAELRVLITKYGGDADNLSDPDDQEIDED